MNTGFWLGHLKERDWLKVMAKLKNVTILHCCYGWCRSLHMTAQETSEGFGNRLLPNCSL